jgi:glycosyltransferase involved in cell wall biosynthesis
MLVSIVTPVYNGAHVLAETIRSVQNQAYPNFEHILVDDGSTDESEKVIKSVSDNRIRYIKLPENKGSDLARSKGINAARGEVIAFLDQDDLFHPDKIRKHTKYFDFHSELGFTYNGRFEFIGNINNIRNIWIPPEKLDLEKITSSHVLSPSDMVVRKEWIQKSGLLENYSLIGSEIIWLGNLILSGCEFARVDGILNYRRFYHKRLFSDLESRCMDELKCRDIIFSDPRCPQEVRATRNVSFANNYLVFAKVAFAQDETTLGQKFLIESVNLNPSLLTGNPPALVTSLASPGNIYEDEHPEGFVRRVFGQLPREMDWLIQYIGWAIAYRYLSQGMRKLVYADPDQGKKDIFKANELGVAFTQSNIRTLNQMILDHWIAVGPEKGQRVLNDVCSNLDEIGERNSATKLKAEVTLNIAFKHYKQGNYRMVPGEAINAVLHRPGYLLNRGVLSIFLRSLNNIIRQ